MTDSEKDYNDHVSRTNEPVSHHHDNDDVLRQMRTAGSISLSPEMFEKLYLQPRNEVKGDLRKTFANPTPLALIGFLIALTPLSIDLMGWRGAGGSGAANIGPFFFFGGVLMLIGSVLEFVLGNTFPFVVFGSFGAFWLSYGSTLQPFFNAAGAYAEGNHYEGLVSPGFANSYAFFLLSMAFLCLIFLVASLRTNIVFVGIFASLVPGFCLLAAAFWTGAQGNAARAANLQKAGGAFVFITAALGWYIFFSQMLASVDFPFSLPVGDLSTMIKGRMDRRRKAKTVVPP